MAAGPDFTMEIKNNHLTGPPSSVRSIRFRVHLT